MPKEPSEEVSAGESGSLRHSDSLPEQSAQPILKKTPASSFRRPPKLERPPGLVQVLRRSIQEKESATSRSSLPTPTPLRLNGPQLFPLLLPLLF